MLENRKIFIKNIRIKNFKSFSNCVELGPLHPKLNVIIGPNGIGKSNVFDSILFVLGKKVSDVKSRKYLNLINKAFPDNKPFASCSVILRIEKRSCNGFLDKIKEISVTKKLFRTKNFKYYLNGKPVQNLFLKQIFFYLKFPIGRKVIVVKQGEIEKFSKMESIGKLKKKMGFIEYLEEISGSSCYSRFFLKNLKLGGIFYIKKN